MAASCSLKHRVPTPKNLHLMFKDFKPERVLAGTVVPRLKLSGCQTICCRRQWNPSLIPHSVPSRCAVRTWYQRPSKSWV